MDQGSIYVAFIDGELKAERERRAALDARGLSVVTSSGSLVALLAAIGAFASGSGKFELPSGARLLLMAMLAAFASAAALGILVNQSRPYDVALTETLDKMVTDRWGDDRVDSRNNVARLNIRTIHTLRNGNDRKARLLSYALLAQLVALVALGAVVSMVAWSG